MLTVFIAVGGYIFINIDDKHLSAAAILMSASLALVGAVINIRFQRQTSREVNSLDFQKSLANNEEYERHKITIYQVIQNSAINPIETFAKVENISSPEAIAIRYILNTWERAANAMKHRLYDEKYLYYADKTMVLNFGVYLRSYIAEKQKSNISLYADFNWLVLKWAIRRDSFEEKKTKKALKRIFKDLNLVRHGKIPPHLK